MIYTRNGVTYRVDDSCGEAILYYRDARGVWMASHFIRTRSCTLG